MDHRIIDLHVHSTESDGTLTPEDLVAEAKKAELSKRYFVKPVLFVVSAVKS